MTRGKCQVCGRVKPIIKDGTVAKHYRKSALCLGSYSPPYELDCSAIMAALEHYRLQDTRSNGQFKRHRDERRNSPLPSYFWDVWLNCHREINRLTRRLKNWERDIGRLAK